MGSPLMNGLLDGLGAVDKIRSGQRAQQQLDLNKQTQQNNKVIADQAQAQQERDNNYQDIQRLRLLNTVARPIQGGMVSDGGNVGAIAGPTGASSAMPTGEGQTFQFFRKADPSRTVRLNVQGQNHEFELPTTEEQARETLRQATAASDLENTGKLNLLRGQNELNQVDLPGYGKVPKAAIPFYTSAEDNKAKAAAAELKPDKPDPSTVIHDSRPLTDDQGNTKQVITYQDGHVVTRPLDAKGKTKTLAATTPGTPEDTAAVAQAIADYKMPAPTLSRALSNRGLMAKVLQLNPNYNGTYFPTAQKTENAFTSGREAKSVNAANTALGHLGNLSDAGEALDSGNVKILNHIANSFGVQIGKDPVTTYQTIVHRVGPELVSAYVGAGGGQGEREIAEKDFDPAASPAQRRSAIAVTAKLLKSKVDALNTQYSQGTQGRGKLKLLSPESQSTLERLSSGGAGSFSVKDPKGGVHTFPTQQAADNFKRAAGIP